MVDVTHNGAQFERAMREVPDKLYKNLRKGFKRHHMGFLAHFQKTRFNRLRKGVGVQSRSGQLSDAFHTDVQGTTLDSLVGRTFSAGNKYARMQEDGAMITPKRGKYLAIPLDAAKTAAGVQRKPPRQWNDTFFIRSKKGTLLLMQTRGRDMIPLFALVKKVIVKGDLGFGKTWNEYLPKFIKMVDKAAADALKPEVVA